MSDDTQARQERERQQEEQRQRAQDETTQDRDREHSVTTDNRIGRENTSVPEHTREPPPPTEPAPFGANPKPPLKILNLDEGGGIDWLDFGEPAPMELLTAIYDNSRDGPVTLWSRKLVEANFSGMLWNWLLDADNAWRSRTLAMQLWEPPTEVPPRPNGISMQEISFTMPQRKRENGEARERSRQQAETPAQRQSPPPPQGQTTQAGAQAQPPKK